MKYINKLISEQDVEKLEAEIYVVKWIIEEYKYNLANTLSEYEDKKILKKIKEEERKLDKMNEAYYNMLKNNNKNLDSKIYN